MPAAPVPSRRQRKSEQTRMRLLDAGLELFLENGYDAASIGEVTKRADLGAGTYYLYFRDKRGLYEAMVRRELRELQKRWVEARASEKPNGDPRSEISLMIELVLESLMEDLPRARLILLDGPPLETFLIEEIGREVTQVLGDKVSDPEIVSNLVIGATLNAARWALTGPRAVSTRRLIAAAVAFCAAGLPATSEPKKKRRT